MDETRFLMEFARNLFGDLIYRIRRFPEYQEKGSGSHRQQSGSNEARVYDLRGKLMVLLGGFIESAEVTQCPEAGLDGFVNARQRLNWETALHEKRRNSHLTIGSFEKFPCL